MDYALSEGYIIANPAKRVVLPKLEKYVASFYNQDELNRLLKAVKGTRMETITLLTAYYGLRRSEVFGLNWQSIDFAGNCITIENKIIHAKDGDEVVVKSKPNLKNTSSRRSLPLTKDIRVYLEKLYEQQKANQEKNKLYYSEKYSDYVCVNEIGEMMSPNNVGKQLAILLKRNNLRHIRFHNLRHSCATLMLANGVPLKDLQLWLRHSSIGTTSAFYAHRVF